MLQLDQHPIQNIRKFFLKKYKNFFQSNFFCFVFCFEKWPRLLQFLLLKPGCSRKLLQFSKNSVGSSWEVLFKTSNKQGGLQRYCKEKGNK